jgi:transposase-like protein
MGARLSRTFYAERKAKVLTAAAIPGCVIANLARSHSMHPSMIHKWLRQQRELAKTKVSAIDSAPKFLEVAITESEPLLTQSATLQKASLTFSEFSFVLEGKVNSTKLINILKALEG